MLDTAAATPDAKAADAERNLTDGWHLVIEALTLNGIKTIYGVPGIPITDLGRLAQAAGMRVIAITNSHPAEELQGADHIVQTYQEISDLLMVNSAIANSLTH